MKQVQLNTILCFVLFFMISGHLDSLSAFLIKICEHFLVKQGRSYDFLNQRGKLNTIQHLYVNLYGELNSQCGSYAGLFVQAVSVARFPHNKDNACYF